MAPVLLQLLFCDPVHSTSHSVELVNAENLSQSRSSHDATSASLSVCSIGATHLHDIDNILYTVHCKEVHMLVKAMCMLQLFW